MAGPIEKSCSTRLKNDKMKNMYFAYLALSEAFGRFAWQKIGISSRPANPIWRDKNYQDDRLIFLKIHSSSVFFST